LVRRSIAEQIQPTRRRILELLKRHGGLTADELAGQLKITTMGTRRHLTTLERDGLVAYDVVQRGMGRPSYLYRLTELGNELFPTGYPQLTLDLLQLIRELEDAATIEQLFLLHSERRLERARSGCGHLAGIDRVRGLLDLLNAEGYMAELVVESEGEYLLCQYNCPIRAVADEFPCACSSELRFLRRFLPGSVEREAHLLAGSDHCTYRIRLR